LQHALDELGDGAFAECDLGDFSARGEDAEGWVDGDLLYGLGFGGWFCAGLDFGQVEAGDLEAVEQEAGAAGVDVVCGYALQDLADGGLDGGAVFGQRQVEGGAAAAALFGVRDWLSGGVVVVAELFLTEAWAGAAVAVGEDVAALILLGCFGCVLHVFPPHGVLFCA